MADSDLSANSAEIRLEALTAFTGRATCESWRRQFHSEFGSRPEEVAPIVSIAAATGTTSPVTPEQPTATGTRQPPGTTT